MTHACPIGQRKQETYLEHDCQHGCVECREHDAIESQRDASQGAELAETADLAIGANKEDSNFQDVVTEDDIAFLVQSFEDDITSGLHATVLLGCESVRMSENFLCETKGFVEADGAYEEGKRFAERDRVQWDSENAAQGKCEEERLNGREKDAA